MNGDGIDDVIVGAYLGDNGGTNAGEAYVIFGRSAGLADIDLSSLTASDGFIIQGDAANDSAGAACTASPFRAPPDRCISTAWPRTQTPRPPALSATPK